VKNECTTRPLNIPGALGRWDFVRYLEVSGVQREKKKFVYQLKTVYVHKTLSLRQRSLLHHKTIYKRDIISFPKCFHPAVGTFEVGVSVCLDDLLTFFLNHRSLKLVNFFFVISKISLTLRCRRQEYSVFCISVHFQPTFYKKRIYLWNL